MIKEAYCNYEMSMLLKEKGFNEYCSGYYKFDKSLGILSKAVINNSALDDDGIDISAPTHQMVLAWLREVHKWSIQVFPVFDNLKWCYDIYELKIQKYHSRPELLSDVDYDTYEEAVEAAIKYVLENLI